MPPWRGVDRTNAPAMLKAPALAYGLGQDASCESFRELRTAPLQDDETDGTQAPRGRGRDEQR